MNAETPSTFFNIFFSIPSYIIVNPDLWMSRIKSMPLSKPGGSTTFILVISHRSPAIVGTDYRMRQLVILILCSFSHQRTCARDNPKKSSLQSQWWAWPLVFQIYRRRWVKTHKILSNSILRHKSSLSVACATMQGGII